MKECLIKRIAPAYSLLVKGVLIALCVVFSLFMLLTMSKYMLIATVAMIIITVFAFKYYDCEYEYNLTEKELTIERILGKSYRKNMMVVDMSRLVIMAYDGYDIGGFAPNDCKVYDYSSHNPENAHNVYNVIVTYRNEKVKLIFEPCEEMVDMIAKFSGQNVHKLI